MKFNEYDTVILLKDYPIEGLRKGDIGAVVMIHTKPNEAYEVEFVDEGGITKALLALRPEEIEKYNK
jgi:hypothetical protein